MSRGLSIVGTKHVAIYFTEWEMKLFELGVAKSRMSNKRFLESIIQIEYKQEKKYKKNKDKTIKKVFAVISEEVFDRFSQRAKQSGGTYKEYIIALIQSYINDEFALMEEEIDFEDYDYNRTRDKSIGMSLGEVERNLIREQAENKGLSIVDYLVDLIRNAELKKYVKEKNKYLRKYSLVIKVTEEEHDMIKEKAKFSELSMPNYIMTLVEEDIHKK